MVKESRKQIKAQLTNEVSHRFKRRIDILETELRCVRNELRECDNQRRKAECTVLKLKEQLEKYEDWNRRLQEFMDMEPDARDKAIANLKVRSEISQKMKGVIDFYSRFMFL